MMEKKYIQYKKIVSLTESIYDVRIRKYPKWKLTIEDIYESHKLNRDCYYKTDRLTEDKNDKTIYLLERYKINTLYKFKLKKLLWK